ncbi:MAG: hypothetical protein HRT68_13590, partial [Flavobacteriaceae bacterium]|nr:hypothetical protein [Flavobacteriaceae bacterium]
KISDLDEYYLFEENYRNESLILYSTLVNKGDYNFNYRTSSPQNTNYTNLDCYVKDINRNEVTYFDTSRKGLKEYFKDCSACIKKIKNTGHLILGVKDVVGLFKINDKQ